MGYRSGPGTRYWTLRSAANRPELYLRHSRLGAFFGFSFHENPDYWQAKIVERSGAEPQYVRFPRPDEFHPGYTKAIELQLNAGIAGWGFPSTKQGVVWQEATSPDRVLHFSVIIERVGANMSSWPGRRAMATALIGRLTMADGATVVVVAYESQAEDATYNVPVTDEQAVRSSILDTIDRGGDPWMLLWGTANDGTVVVLEGPVRPVVTQAPDD